MPILVIAVVAFIIFNIMMAMFIMAVVAEQRQDKKEHSRVLSDMAALDAAPPKSSTPVRVA